MKRMTLTTTLLAGMLLLAVGCNEVSYNPKTGELREIKPPAKQSDHLASETVTDDSTDANGQADAPDGQGGATDIALKWANKYATLSNELVYANKRIHELEKEAQDYQTQIAGLKAELGRTQRELADANAMLGDMKSELAQWRSNVLGYRREMMASLGALMTSQQKVLELLGAEVPAAGQPLSQAPTKEK